MNDLAVEDIEHAEGYVLASEKDMLFEILRKLNKIERRLMKSVTRFNFTLKIKQGQNVLVG